MKTFITNKEAKDASEQTFDYIRDTILSHENDGIVRLALNEDKEIVFNLEYFVDARLEENLIMLSCDEAEEAGLKRFVKAWVITINFDDIAHSLCLYFKGVVENNND